MGDCDDDSHCMPGLKCGRDNCWSDFRIQNGFNWDFQADCCYGKTTTINTHTHTHIYIYIYIIKDSVWCYSSKSLIGLIVFIKILGIHRAFCYKGCWE